MARQRFAGAMAALAAGFVVVCSAGGAALATGPVVLGPGVEPNLTIDSAGTAYVVWQGSETTLSTKLFFCRFPRGASACAPLTQFTPPGDQAGRPFAVASGSTVQIVQPRLFSSGTFSQNTYVYTSHDGGATFDSGTIAGPTAAYADFASGPGNAVSGVTSGESSGLYYERVPLDATVASGRALLSSDHIYSGTVALDGTNPVVVGVDLNGNGQLRRFSGSGDVNDATTWSPAVDVGTLDTPSLVSGPSGLFLLEKSSPSGDVIESRKFDGVGFGARVPIIANGRVDDAVEDGGGMLHVLGRDGNATEPALFHATSDDGVAWKTEDIPFGKVPVAIHAAVAPDHAGFAVGTFSGESTVWINPIGAVGPAEPTGPPAPAGGESPVLGKTAGVVVISGVVYVQRRGTTRFVKLTGKAVIPSGSIVDTTRGKVRLTTALPTGGSQSIELFEGAFRLRLGLTGVADLELTGGNLRKCRNRSAGHAAKAKAKTIRHLWAHGTGDFRTDGRYASASVRGSTWNTVDRCDGTLVRVTSGKVRVTDGKRFKTVVVSQGHSYFVRKF